MSLQGTHGSQLSLVIILPVLVALFAVACGSSEPDFDPETFDPFTNVPIDLGVGSPDFGEGETIPARLTCDGDDETPIISWRRPPNGTESVAVIVDDPDAPRGIFTHWVVFNLQPENISLQRGIPDRDAGANGPLEGKNDFGDRGYGGPCPPRGQTHEYRFSVYALTDTLALDEDAGAEDVLKAMQGLVIGHGVLSANYSRQ